MQRLWWLSLASITYALAFWFPEALWWCIFIYPVGIIVAGTRYGIPWYAGYLWGAATFTLHAIGIYIGLYYLADGPTILRMLPACLMSLYVAIFPASVFWAATYIQRYLPQKISRVLLWIGALCILTLLYEYVVLIIFGNWEGYPLMHPLVPLAAVPQLISLLPIIGKLSYTLLLYMTSGAVAYAMLVPHYRHVTWILLPVFIWLISYYVHVQQRIDDVPIEQVTVIPITFPQAMQYTDIREMLSHTIQLAQEQYPQTQTYVMPESAIHRSDADTLAQEILQETEATRLIYGAFAWCNDTYHNILSVSTHDTTQTYYKRHALPITERIPYILDYAWLRNQYCGREPEITEGTGPRKPVQLLDTMTCIPYICSELFLAESPSDNQHRPILFIGNDMWLYRTTSHYMSTLMLLYARICAIAWQRPIWYATHIHAYYITTSGEMRPLQVFA